MPEPMPPPVAVAALSALAHASRLAVFRLLVRAGPEGMAAGHIAREIGALPSTLSTHLAILDQAGLLHARREGRSIVYAVAYYRMRDLLGFLIADCCGGRAELCGSLPALAEAARCRA